MYPIIQGILIVLALLAAVFLALLKIQAGCSKPKEVKKEEKKTFRRLFYGKDSVRSNKIRRFLSEMGANYMLKREIDPMEYVLARFGMGILGGIAGAANSSWILTLTFFFVGFEAIPSILKLSNAGDNKKMLADIKSIYDTLIIKTEAGVFFTNALQECYKVVENQRLKTALLELDTDILVNQNIASAIAQFNQKFKNPYVDTFCMIIRQALESGQTLQVLKDLSGQMSNIQKAVHAAEKERQELQVMKVEMLVYAMILVMVCYYVLSMMGGLVGELL